MQQLATMFGVGRIHFAPGTFGSLAATALALPVLMLPMGWAIVALAVPILTVLGSYAAHAYMHAHRIPEEAVLHDPSAIVVDEWAGQWLTFATWHAWMFFMAIDSAAGQDLLNDLAGDPLHLLYGFILFRFFDIMKPWPIRWADRTIKGGFGVMFDDLLAGIAAGTVLYAIYFFGPLVSGQMMETQV